jgi:hypothetical protein
MTVYRRVDRFPGCIRLMRVAMMTVRISGAGHFFNGDYAAVCFRAADVLELDGGVADVVMIFENVVEIDENAGALRWGNVGDGDVAGEGAGVGAEAPDMEVVDVDDAFDGFHAGANLREGTAAWRAFKKDVEGFADNADAGPEDEGGDKERKDGVDPVLAGDEDSAATSDDGCCREGVAGHVEEGRTHVDVASYTPEECGDDAVHQDAGCGDDHHQPGLDGDRRREAMDGFDCDPERDDDERGGVDKGGEDSGALIAECLGVAGGAGLEVDGGEAEQEGQEIRRVVAGLREQCEGVGAQPGYEGDNDISQRGNQRKAENGFCSACADRGGRGVNMHGNSIPGVGM